MMGRVLFSVGLNMLFVELVHTSLIIFALINQKNICIELIV